jgi:ferredoxin
MAHRYKKLKNTIFEKKNMKIIVDTDKCIGCGTCVAVCPNSVYEIKNGKSNPAHPEKCVLCQACIMNCPVGAITIIDDKGNKYSQK